MNDIECTGPLLAALHRPIRQRAVVALVVACVACGGLVAFTKRDPENSIASASVADPAQDAGGADTGLTLKPVVAGAAGLAASTPDATAADANQDLVGAEVTPDTGCTLTERSIRAGTTGPSVACLQTALASAGFYSGAATASFDQATDAAVRVMQTTRDLFVDGVVGRESAISLGIWADEASLVVHTPKPPAGAKDLLGFLLSSVATSGPHAPPLPPNSGSGKRLVYDRSGQRIWAVSKDETVIRSWLVSGSKFGNETPGTHQVYSRSEVSTAWNGKAFLPHMVRWLKTDLGNIGFHGIPLHVSDGTVYQTEADLGKRLSGGCQRQANPDADFVWEFAQIGTTVVVI